MALIGGLFYFAMYGIAIVAVLACAGFVTAFLINEHRQRYVPAVIFKGLASGCFAFLGLLFGMISNNPVFGRLVFIGLVLGFVADILLNLRHVVKSAGQKVFLIGICVFLVGHVMYLVALLQIVKMWWLWLAIGAVLTVGLVLWIFSRITASKVFKIFGVFYLGAIMLMTTTAIGALIMSPSPATILFAIGSVSFLVSDVVLILNTFGGQERFSLRVTNICFYYVAQMLIAVSLIARTVMCGSGAGKLGVRSPEF